MRGNMITNGDQGIVLTWAAPEPEDWKSHMVVTTGASASEVNSPTTQDDVGVVPMLQLQDGSFVGTTDDGGSSMIAFDATGKVRWVVPGYCPMIATADGGVIAQGYVLDLDDWSASCSGPTVTFDQNGNATGQMAALGGTGLPNWAGQIYAVGTSGVELDSSWVGFGSGFASLSGGNPSGNGTSVLNLGLSEGLPMWLPNWLSSLLGGQPKCKLGTDKIALGQEVLSKDQQSGAAALAQYIDLKQKLLTFLGSLTPTSTCATFFNANPQRAPYWSQLITAITRQVPYDGPLSNLSMYDAGAWTQKDMQDVDAWPHFKEQAVCVQYWDGSGLGKRTVASAQTQPPGTDVYIATQKSLLKYLAQSTILHESLHNLTGLDDPDLYNLLTGKKLPDGPTTPINTALEQNGCVGKQ